MGRQPRGEGNEAEGCGGEQPPQSDRTLRLPWSLKRSSWLRLPLFLLLPFEAGVEAVAVAGDVEDIHVVREAIEQRPGQSFIVGEDLRPLGKRQVRGHDQAGLLI